MKRKILFCGNGMSAEVIPKLSLEYDIAVITEFPNDFGLEKAKIVIEANSKKPKEALEKAIEIWEKNFKFEAVLSLCWDCPESVSIIAKYFNLKGISREIAQNSSNKYARSKRFYEKNVTAPKFCEVSSLEELIKMKDDFTYPIILKPNNLSSSKGVIRVDNEDALISAFNYATSFIKPGEKHELVMNEFIEGTEYSAEGLMIDAKLFLTGVSERIFEYKKYYPNFVEVGDILPSDLLEKEEFKLHREVEKAALSLGIYEGVIKADVIKSKEGKFYIIELTPRLGGPRFGTEMIPLSNGTNVLKAYIQQLLDLDIDLNLLKSKFSRGVVNRSLFPKEGEIVDIKYEGIKNNQGFYDFKWWNIIPLRKGDYVRKPEFGCGNVGYIIVTGETREEAIYNANKVESSFQFDIKQRQGELKPNEF